MGEVGKEKEQMRQYTDKCLNSFDRLANMVADENVYQIHKWGVQAHTAFEWVTYITEELGELAEAISEHQYRKGNKQEVVRESIQVATLALKIAEMFNDENE